MRRTTPVEPIEPASPLSLNQGAARPLGKPLEPVEPFPAIVAFLSACYTTNTTKF